jgi:hypothetical protein
MLNSRGTVHPDGCMCQPCIEAREMEDDGEDETPVQRPPVQQPPRPRGRPRKNGNSQIRQYPDTYTQPVPAPTHPHSRYEYEFGEMRRCHLCCEKETTMSYMEESPQWFASLEHRARHILEVHTDESDPIIKRERSRAKEILGIKELWDRHSMGQVVEMGKPLMDEYVSSPTSNRPTEPKKSILGGLMGGTKKENVQKVSGGGNWFMQHKLISVILFIAILYGLYVMYLMSQGYEF